MLGIKFWLLDKENCKMLMVLLKNLEIDMYVLVYVISWLKILVVILFNCV